MQPTASSSLRPQRQPAGVVRFVRDLDPRAIDVLVAAVLTVMGLAISLNRPAGDGFRNDDLLAAVLVAGQTLPLAVRRVAPLAVVAAISVALIAHSAIGYEVVQAGTLASLIALYGAASLTEGRQALFAAVITVVAVAGFYVTNRGDWGAADIAATSATWALAWLFGTVVRIRGQQAEAAGARVASLEQEQDARAREAVADERARMARELHDIVGHALNLIVIQASGAQRVFDSRPEVPREALGSIETTGREALQDMERMLGVLRAPDAGDSTRGPQPGLDQLSALAAHVSEAGLKVDIEIEGERVDVPTSVDLSAYRIVQESLTNCLKHAQASHAKVTVRYRPDEIEVNVVDDGRGAMADARRSDGGRGQLGMRERVALFGGEISMGGSDSGYRVHARLPFRPTQA